MELPIITTGFKQPNKQPTKSQPKELDKVIFKTMQLQKTRMQEKRTFDTMLRFEMDPPLLNSLLNDVMFNPQAMSIPTVSAISQMQQHASTTNDSRFQLEIPEEDVWIPSDQTLHWRKRPNYIYPTVRLLKKDELPSYPRGSKLVAKLSHTAWTWDDNKFIDDGRRQRADPNTTSCLDDDKTIVPFEKGSAVFRHLRIAKHIKLKRTETFTITSLTFEIGYHNPFTKIPFKSLEIYISKPTKIHIVAHKGSVKLMQKHGLLPNVPGGIKEDHSSDAHVNNNNQTTNQNTENKESGEVITHPHPIINQNQHQQQQQPQPHAHTPHTPHSQPHTQSHPHTPHLHPTPMPVVKQVEKKRPNEALLMPSSSSHLEMHKKLKTCQLCEVMEEITTMQQQMDVLKKRIQDYIRDGKAEHTEKGDPDKPDQKVRVSCNPEQFKPIMFIFYAFRTYNLELAKNLIKAFNFDINEKDPTTGYTVLHVAAKHGFAEGVKWCLENGGEVNAATDLGCTPLHLAYLRNDKNIKKLLKNEGSADPSIVNCYGLKPKDYAHSRKALVRPLPKTACSVEVIIDGYNQPFCLEIWFAARIGWLEVVKLYIEQLGCDVDVRNTNGQSPLMCACEHGRLNVAAYLMTKGADSNSRDIHDSTPLHYAYMAYDPTSNADITTTVIDLLIRQGADPNLKNVWGRPPIWYKDKTIESPWKWSSTM